MNVVGHVEPEDSTTRTGGMTLRSVAQQKSEHHRGNDGRYDVNSVASSPYPNSVASSPITNSVASFPVPNSAASSPVANSVASSPGPVDDDYFDEGDGFVEEDDVYMDEYDDDW